MSDALYCMLPHTEVLKSMTQLLDLKVTTPVATDTHFLEMSTGLVGMLVTGLIKHLFAFVSELLHSDTSLCC